MPNQVLDGEARQRAAGCRDETDVERARSQEEEILARLRLAGAHGCLNAELWEICHAVNSRVAGLRKRGYRIVSRNEGDGVWTYTLLGDAEQAARPAAVKSARKPRLQLALFAEAGVRE